MFARANFRASRFRMSRPLRSASPFGILAFAFLAAALAGQTPTFVDGETFVPPGARLALAVDLDGDGDVDLLGSSGATTAINDGTGAFALGWPGAAAGNWFGNYTTAPYAIPWTAAAFGDVNGDGIGDLVFGLGEFPVVVSANWRAGLPGGGFAPPVQLPVPAGLAPFSVELGDVDGDGDLDVATGQETTSFPGPRLLLNAGGASFVDVSVAHGLLPLPVTSVAWNDLDGDGLLDLVAIGKGPYAPGPVGVAFAQRNLGGGYFDLPVQLPGTQVPYVSPSAARRPVVGDFDADGLRDVLRFGDGLQPVTLARQTAPFVFTDDAAVPLGGAVPFRFRAAAAADLNGDGRDEAIVVGDRGIATFSYALGAWSTFLPEIPLTADGVAAFDADGDADVDLLVSQASGTGHPRYRLLLNGGAAGLEFEPEGPAATSGVSVSATGDFAGDAAPDVLTLAPTIFFGSRALLSENFGDGRFGAAHEVPISGGPATFTEILQGGFYPQLAVGADFDGDGDADMAVANVRMPTPAWSNCVALLRNDGGAGFVGSVLDANNAPATEHARRFATADFDGDGVADLFVAASRTLLFLGGAGGPAPALAARPTTTAIDAAVGDFDDDGDPDLVLRTTGGQATFWSNQGGGAFALGATLVAPADGAVAAGDFTGDGLADVVYGGRLFARTGPFAFAPPTPVAAATGQFVACDADADGDVDLLAAGGQLLLNSGGGALVLGTPLPSNATPGAVADLDRDGDIDVVREGPRAFFGAARRLAARAPARPGRTTGFDVYGPPNGAFLLAVSAFPATFQDTPFGRLALEPTLSLPIIAGPLDATGRAGFAAQLAAGPWSALAGASFVFQAIVDGPGPGPRLTNPRTLRVYAP